MSRAVPVGRRVRVHVPATSANLGPGFDSLGLALDLISGLEAEAVDTPGVHVEIEGIGAGEVAGDETNLIAASLIHVLQAAGVEAPGLRMHAVNRIPHGRGMGSSGAAIVAGVLAAKGLLSGVVDLSDDDLLALATELEGHPDNVAPALFGGLTIAWTDDGVPHHKQLDVHPDVCLLLAVPGEQLSTEKARALQPETVPHIDAVFNVSRAALLVAALTQSPDMLMPATEDRLHQGYRAPAMQASSDLIARLRADGHAAVVSGAGPSVLVMCGDEQSRLSVAKTVGDAGGWEALLLGVDSSGGTVEVLPTSERP